MSSSPPLVVADRYRLVAPLGQGGMGRVWRATDVVLHRDVAIKELVPPPGLTLGERQEMRERSLREARAIARLNNINVVRVFDVLRTDADPWIVMEYVASRSLQDTLASDGPFHPLRVVEIGLGVLGALRAAHRAGVVHRDVKPGNVLLGADGRVVLTDFGLATVPGDPNVTRTGLVLGSPAYIAPERARDGTSGPAADLWSLGATLYAAVEGASPFARPSAIATLAALATENPPPARNAGPLKPVLNGLLRKDPTHRINLDEAERLLNRAAGRRSKLSFPMSPTMRRPGVGRERGAGGLMAPTGATPVVPGPRPPIVPARAADPPGRPPVSGGRPAAGEGRPPVFVPGKAPVGRPGAETPTRVDGPKADAPRLDATRVDTPPVRDDKTTFMGTRGGSTTAPGQPPASRQIRPAVAPANPSTRTGRGERGGLTASDVAANRRRKAAPEHEQSLADATALVANVGTPTKDAPSADATTVVGPLDPAADATTVVGAPPGPAPKPAVSKPPAKPAAATVTPAERAPEKPAAVAPAERAQERPAVVAPAERAQERPAAVAPAEQAQERPASAAPERAQDQPAAVAPAEQAQDKSATATVAPPEQAPEKTATTGISDMSDNVGGSGLEDRADAASPAKKADSADKAGSAKKPGSTKKAGSAKAAARSAQSSVAEPTSAAKRAGADNAEAQAKIAEPAEAAVPAAGALTDTTIAPGSGSKTASDAGDKTDSGAGPAEPGADGKAEFEADSPAGFEADNRAEFEADNRAEFEADNRAEFEADNRAEFEADSPAEFDADGRAGFEVDGRAETDGRAESGAGDKADKAEPAGRAEPDAGGQAPTDSDVEAEPTAAATPEAGRPAEAVPAPETPDEPEQPASRVHVPLARPAEPASEQASPAAPETPDVLAPISPIPPVGRPARPAWRPMEVRPAPRRGVTVFGTRLTYPQAGIGAAALLVVLVLLIVLITQAFGDDAGTPPANPTTAGTRPTAGASVAQPAGPGGTTGATTGAPSTGSTPSSPPASSASGSFALPAGWRMYVQKASGGLPGFSIPIPNGAKLSGGGDELQFRWNNRLLIIGRTGSPQADAYQDWQNQESARRGTYRNYKLLGIRPVKYRDFESAADWEFLYTTSAGNAQHAVKRNIRVDASAAFNLSWYATPEDWKASQADLQVLYQGFQPQ